MSFQKSLKYRESSINYTISGSGRPVMFLHGFPVDGNLWGNFRTELSNEYMIIVPDIPGSGKSEILNDTDRPVGMEDYAEVIYAIVQEETLEKVCIIGHSMGGYIALAFAEKYPELLYGIGLFHSTAFADDQPKKETRLKAINFVTSNGAHAFLKTTIPNMFGDNFKKNHPDVITDLTNKSARFLDDSVIQYYNAMMNRKDRSAVLKDINVPVLIIIGEQDQALPLEQSLKQTHLAEKSFIKILPGVGHMGMLENPGECLLFIKDYLTQLD